MNEGIHLDLGTGIVLGQVHIGLPQHGESSSSSSIGVQEILPIPPTVIRTGLGACNRCDRCL